MVPKYLKKFAKILPNPLLIFLVKIYFYSKKTGLFSWKKNNRIFDDKGVPYVNYEYVEGIYIGNQRNPVSISQEAFTIYKKFEKTKDEKSKKLLINNADWLVENSNNHNDYAILEYNFPWPVYDLEKPWRSAMAQGQAIQALIKADKISANKKYLETALSLLNSFYIEVKKGGVTYKDSENEWWYEEYASNKGKIPRVLNGMIFALLGINDFYKYTNNNNAKFLFEQGIRSLKKNLPKYDYENGYSFYDLLGRPSRKYHAVHVELMKKLFEITDEKIFRIYYEKWKDYDYFQNLPGLIVKEIKNS